MAGPQTVSDAAAQGAGMTAPAAYAKSRLGLNVLAWMCKKGWIDRRTVQRLPEPAPLLARLRGGPETDVARKVI